MTSDDKTKAVVAFQKAWVDDAGYFTHALNWAKDYFLHHAPVVECHCNYVSRVGNRLQPFTFTWVDGHVLIEQWITDYMVARISERGIVVEAVTCKHDKRPAAVFQIDHYHPKLLDGARIWEHVSTQVVKRPERFLTDGLSSCPYWLNEYFANVEKILEDSWSHMQRGNFELDIDKLLMGDRSIYSFMEVRVTHLLERIYKVLLIQAAQMKEYALLKDRPVYSPTDERMFLHMHLKTLRDIAIALDDGPVKGDDFNKRLDAAWVELAEKKRPIKAIGVYMLRHDVSWPRAQRAIFDHLHGTPVFTRTDPDTPAYVKEPIHYSQQFIEDLLNATPETYRPRS